MSQEPPSTVHYVMVTTAGFSHHADWAALRRTAAETNSVVSAVVLDGDRAITVTPAQPARIAALGPTLPRPTQRANDQAWAALLDSIFHAQVAIPTIQRTEVHIFGEAEAALTLGSMVQQDTSITVRLRGSTLHAPAPVTGAAPPWTPPKPGTPSLLLPADKTSDSVGTDQALVALRRRLAGGMNNVTNGATKRDDVSNVSAPSARTPVHTPGFKPVPVLSPSAVNATHRRNARTTVKGSFKAFGVMVALAFPLWLLTPVVASFGSLMIPGLSAAVFASNENGGRTAADSPMALYGHLAWLLGITCVMTLLMNLLLGLADERLTWLPIVFVLGGLVGFFWLVSAHGGQLWMWDVPPASGFVGYILAQLLTRIRET